MGQVEPFGNIMQDVDTDTPQKADVIFLSGGSYPKMPEYAAELFHVVYVINYFMLLM